MKPSKSKGLCNIFTIENVKTNEWYFDSSATYPMASMKAIAKGSLSLHDSEGCVYVGSVFRIPDLATSSLSLSTICKRCHKMIFSADKCVVEVGSIILKLLWKFHRKFLR